LISTCNEEDLHTSQLLQLFKPKDALAWRASLF